MMPTTPEGTRTREILSPFGRSHAATTAQPGQEEPRSLPGRGPYLRRGFVSTRGDPRTRRDSQLPRAFARLSEYFRQLRNRSFAQNGADALSAAFSSVADGEGKYSRPPFPAPPDSRSSVSNAVMGALWSASGTAVMWQPANKAYQARSRRNAMSSRWMRAARPA